MLSCFQMPKRKRGPVAEAVSKVELDDEDESAEHLKPGVSTRSKTKGQNKKCSDLRTPEGSFEYTSDGASFETVMDDDDEHLPDVSLDSPNKQRTFSKDDIIWAPFKDIYWPAIVTSVAFPYVRYLYINERGSKTSVYRKKWTSLIPFDNPAKNLELKELGERNYVDFRDAYERLVRYLATEERTDLCARRFLTLRDGKVEQAKDCLFRLGVKFEDADQCVDDAEDDSDGCENDDDHCSDPPEDHGIENSALNTNSCNGNQTEGQIKEILKDLETVPDELKVTAEELKEMEADTSDYLKVIQSNKCLVYLRKIREGKEMSSRHSKYRDRGLTQSGFGPFTLFEEKKQQLLTAIDDHCESIDPENIEPLYKYSVMLPEAIIYAITKVKKYSRTFAKQYFDQTSIKVGVQDC